MKNANNNGQRKKKALEGLYSRWREREEETGMDLGRELVSFVGVLCVLVVDIVGWDSERLVSVHE